MSICEAMNLRRIYWYSGHGVAQSVWDKPAVHLEVPPDLGFKFVEIDYEPALQVFQVRPTITEQVRDMTPHERTACAEYLRKL